MSSSSHQIKGPSSYENWLACREGHDPLDAYEVPVFSDTTVSGEVTEGYGPYQFFNPVPTGVPHGTLKPAVFLRIDNHGPENTESVIRDMHERKTKDERYHGGDLDDELAALMSLALGARFKAGGATREFAGHHGPRGRPIRWFLQDDPVLLPPRGASRVPGSVRQKALSDLTPLLSLPLLTTPQAIAVVRVARMYQDALWTADAEPELAWLLLVSAVEIAAGAWKQERASSVERLRAWGPGSKLEEVLVHSGDNELLERVARVLAPYVGSRRSFVDFLLEHCPNPPEDRPGEGGQHSWEPADLDKTFRIIYDCRSSALHSGKPFPAPMCDAPMRLSDWQYPAEIPLGHATATRGGIWIQADTPILLHTFEYVVRTALISWWRSLPASCEGDGLSSRGHG